MRPTTRRLVSVAALTFVVWVVGATASIVAGWPAQSGGPGNPNDVAGEFLSRGTALSPPLSVMVAFALFALLAGSRTWRGTSGVVALCPIAVAAFVGAMGEAFAPATPDIPRAVPALSGVLGVILYPALLFFGIAELIDRARAWWQPSRRRSSNRS